MYVCYKIVYLKNEKLPIFFLVQTRKSKAWENLWLVRVHEIQSLNFLHMIRPVPLCSRISVRYEIFVLFSYGDVIGLWKMLLRKDKQYFHLLNNWLYPPILSLIKSYLSFPLNSDSSDYQGLLEYWAYPPCIIKYVLFLRCLTPFSCSKNPLKRPLKDPLLEDRRANIGTIYKFADMSQLIKL